MKKAGIILLAIIVTLVGGYMLFNITKDKVTGFTLEKALYEYELDTWMENSEVYEFKSKSDPNMITIVFIMDNLKDMETFVIPKATDPKLMVAKTGKQSLLKPDHSYELDTWQENSEVYEFTPRSRLDWTCQVYMLDNLTSMSMKCFPKTTSIDYPDYLR